jgi:hypothetical protein
MSIRRKLAGKLLEIQYSDDRQYYSNRAKYIYEAMALACQLSYDVGFRIDPDEPEWPVAFIELPTGQVSWHMEQHPKGWDKHTTDEKKLRMFKYISDATNEES